MKRPADLYTASTRPYDGLPELTYPFHDRDVVITACGRLCGECQLVGGLRHDPYPLFVPGVPRENGDQPRTEPRASDLSPTLCPRRKDRLTQTEPGFRPSPVLCPKGKFAGSTTGAHKMQCGPLWPPVAQHGHKPLHCSEFYNLTMAGLGLLRSRDCGSHGRGPRFDPLCAHQPSLAKREKAAAQKRRRAFGRASYDRGESHLLARRATHGAAFWQRTGALSEALGYI
jgi:hypothetical protein